MKRLVILDYFTSTVHYYDVTEGTDINDGFIESIGFKPSQTSYMWADTLNIVFHKKAIGK